MSDQTGNLKSSNAFELGKVYGEVQAYLSHAGESEDGPLARTLLAAIIAVGKIPEPGSAPQDIIEAWNRDI